MVANVFLIIDTLHLIRTGTHLSEIEFYFMLGITSI